jgi:hypothetical protein
VRWEEKGVGHLLTIRFADRFSWVMLYWVAFLITVVVFSLLRLYR